MRARRLGLALLAWLMLAAPAIAQSGPFSDWAAIIVAGDWRSHSGAPSEVFDNARRDLGKALIDVGFAPDHIRQFSAHEAKDGPDGPGPADANTIYRQLAALTRETSGGCLIYFTSHGGPEGVVVGDTVWPPSLMATLVDRTCGERPTVVVISACFSGIFVPTVGGPNRMILTAARRDRASFGCNPESRYTYFDTCVLSALPTVSDFVALGAAARVCVARREADTGVGPPSEPQMDIGAALRPLLPLYLFAKPH